ncbi:4-hydroxythreonine-4-phosphate dehydrogenase [Gemmobacter lanyuensis]|uniref:4-hydroxythreonine-4-phosphate dehydrogenase n=1 Tax=Gemmobacter lanyuensis TaxID=1054497 RepID=A0A918MN41_9RHOB|nr:hypothetical protein [Gemmobacter lanyuensis]GGW38890.1 4-hydroxythreonine-4-phosphate dehydrogenase [Gemmobacter lanyuensis]
MKSNLIVMLTLNDVTVADAREVFLASADLPVTFWGFKNVGITPDATRELVALMKSHGKTTVLEVVTYNEASCLENARMAVELGFDYLTGTLFYPSVAEYLADKPIRYFPFFGDVDGSPVTLRGSIDEIVAAATALEGRVHGLDLVAWRHAGGEPVALAKAVVAATDLPVIIAGSISSRERLEIVNEINPFAFTMGSALFEGRFLPGADFRTNLQAVLAAMADI